MTNRDDNIRRLRQALSSGEDPPDHAACQAALPEFVEAEMADEDMARLFPAVQAHLDICEECDALHAEMLDALLAEEAGLLPEVTELPPLNLPRPIRQRQWVRNITDATLGSLKKWRGDLDSATQAFFDALAQTSGRLDLRSPALAFGLGPTDSETLPLVMAAHYALADLIEKHPVSELRALADANRLRPLLERLAGEEARRYGLKGQTVQVFVSTFTDSALGDITRLIDLIDSSSDLPTSDSSD